MYKEIGALLSCLGAVLVFFALFSKDTAKAFAELVLGTTFLYSGFQFLVR